MRCTILASGSKGNCLFVEGASGSILVDAGLSAKETLRRLSAAGRTPDTLRAILVTHEHGDHIAGVDVLSRRLDIPVYATEGTIGELEYRCRSRDHLKSVPCGYHQTFSVDDFTIEPFATSHDATAPCGFIVRENGAILGVCTDTGVVNSEMTENLLRCDGIILESNHCPVMLKEGPYPESLKRRIRSAHGHLSNPAAAECICQLGSNVPTIVLAHLSEINNTPEKAFASARNGLGLLFEETTVIIATQKGTNPGSPQEFTL